LISDENCTEKQIIMKKCFICTYLVTKHLPLRLSGDFEGSQVILAIFTSFINNIYTTKYVYIFYFKGLGTGRLGAAILRLSGCCG
jgi:hypothetical protein